MSSSNASCGDYLLFKMKSLSKSIGKKGGLIRNKTRSISKLISTSLKNSNSNLEKKSVDNTCIDDITIQMGSAYLRKIDFSTLEPVTTKCDDSGYFKKLFSPPTLADTSINSNVSITTDEFTNIDVQKISKNRTVYSKSASQLVHIVL
eukprot:453734_1